MEQKELRVVLSIDSGSDCCFRRIGRLPSTASALCRGSSRTAIWNCRASFNGGGVRIGEPRDTSADAGNCGSALP